MINDHKVTIITEDGMIVNENSINLETKNAEQIIQIYHPDDYNDYILGIRTQTMIEILQPCLVPLQKYPLLKTCKTNSEIIIPKLSLCILNVSEKEKKIIIFQLIAENLNHIQFPPLIYGFSKNDYSKTMASIQTEIAENFGLNISKLQIFLDDKEISNCLCQKFIEEATHKPNLNKILLKFNLDEDGKIKLIMRQKNVQEFINVVKKFCIDIIQFHKQVGEKIKESNLFTEFEYKTVFGSIIDMFNFNARFADALTGNDSYNSFVGNIILRFIPEIEENFKEFIANYRTDELIPEIIKKYKNNQMLETIVHQTFGKSTISFESMAILPVQLLPRFKLLFESILQNTPKSHPEFYLFQKNISEIDKTILNLQNYNVVREVSYLQNRLVPLEENKNHILNINGRFLVSKYDVNTNFISKSILYLLNDLIILTKCSSTCEYEKFRFKYDEFKFFPNFSYSLIVYYNCDGQFEVLKFQSADIMKDMLEQVSIYRQNALDSNANKNNALIAYENTLDDNQSVPSMINSSCYKINSLIVAASYGVYLTFETKNKSLDIFQKVKNINPYAKLIGVMNSPYIYGGEKYPIPLQFSCGKFTELKRIQSCHNQSDCLKNVIPCDEPEFGRVFHTCCSYKEYIVIFGGYKQEKKNRKLFSSDIDFVNVKTGEWFKSKPGPEAEPEARYKHSAVMYKNIMIIHGGISCQDDKVLDNTWFYNFNDGKWSILEFGSKNSLIIPRFGHSAVMVNQFMFIIGGLTCKKKYFNDANSNKQIYVEKSKESNSSNESSNSSENSNSDDDETIYQNLQTNSIYIAASTCFCLNIENCRLFGVDIIGNYLPGLSLFSSIYDDYNKQIILIGGQYQNNKEERYTSVLIKLSIPQFYISSSIPDGEIKSIGRRINRKMSVSLIRTNDFQNLRKNDTKCSSLNDQNPISINSIHDAKTLNIPSTPKPKKLLFPRFFFNVNNTEKENE